MPSAARALQRAAAPRSELSASVCKRLSACRRTRKPPACRDAHDAAVCGIYGDCFAQLRSALHTHT